VLLNVALQGEHSDDGWGSDNHGHQHI
jgi:hypothetical protein